MIIETSPVKKFLLTSIAVYYIKAAYLLSVIIVTGAWTEINEKPSQVIRKVLKGHYRLHWLRDAISYKRQA